MIGGENKFGIYFVLVWIMGVRFVIIVSNREISIGGGSMDL